MEILERAHNAKYQQAIEEITAKLNQLAKT